MSNSAYVLARHLERYADTETPLMPRRRYRHMGATISDAALQAGLNYRTVVAPRVTNVLRHWPRATTTSAFSRKVRLYDLGRLLEWRDPVKLTRAVALADFFLDAGIETEDELSTFLMDEFRAESLLAINGIGRKTVDYLKILAGLPAFAIDRHVKAVIAEAGISCGSYEEARGLMLAAAEYLAVDAAALDSRIWTAMSRRREPGWAESCSVSVSRPDSDLR
jgi:hypothetical protein